MNLSQHVDQGWARFRDAGRAVASKMTQALPSQPKPPPRTEDDYPSLSSPLVTLYVSATYPEQSQEAFRMLEATQTAFRVEPSRDTTITARFAGRTQHGLEGVERLAEGLRSMHHTFLQSDNGDFNAELERRRRPGVREKAQRELREYIDIARLDLDRILSNTESVVQR